MTTLSHEPSSPLKKRSRWRGWLVALLIFVGGAAFGAGVTVVISVRALQQAVQHPERAPARLTARIARRLDLSTAQRRQVLQILTQRQRALQQIRREVQPRVETELSVLDNEILTVLTPNQQAEWKEMLASVRENWLPPVERTE